MRVNLLSVGFRGLRGSRGFRDAAGTQDKLVGLVKWGCNKLNQICYGNNSKSNN